MGITIERKRNVLMQKIRFHEEVQYSYMVDIETATELGLPALLAKATQSADDTAKVIQKLGSLLAALSDIGDTNNE